MSPPHTTGIHAVTRRLSDGSIRTYYYDRRTGRALGTDHDAAIAAAMDPPREAASRGSFEALCVSYLASTKFHALAPQSRALNRRYVDQLRDRFGDAIAAAITRPVVMQLRETLAAHPWHATRTLSTLRLVLQHGVDTGALDRNPALRPGGLHPPRRHAVWSVEQTHRMLTAARPSIRLACALLLYTAQRPADILAMTWAQVSERSGQTWITLRQQKTAEIVDVPAHRELATILAASERRTLLIIPSPAGRPWLYRNFCRAWDAEARRLGIEGVERRDLRRTAMVRMAEAGATAAQIAAVSGHTIAQTSRILDTYIPRRSEVAAGAIEVWERHNRRSVVVPIAGSGKRGGK